jgi:hypothetical protein
METGSYLRDNWCVLDFVIVVASLIDFGLTNYNFAYIKLFRLLRAFRPLRFISKNKNMKVMVTALLESLPGVLNVIFFILVIWIMFAILAVIIL